VVGKTEVRGNGREENDNTSNDRRNPADGPTHDDVSAYFVCGMNLLCQLSFVCVSFCVASFNSVVENGCRVRLPLLFSSV
jgi:hypothetical protein